MLDSKAITEAPARSIDIFSDNRVLRAPLPGIAVGSIVEYRHRIQRQRSDRRRQRLRHLRLRRVRTDATHARHDRRAVVARAAHRQQDRRAAEDRRERRPPHHDVRAVASRDARTSKASCRSTRSRCRTSPSPPARRGGTWRSVTARSSTSRSPATTSRNSRTTLIGNATGAARCHRARAGRGREECPLRRRRSRRVIDHSSPAAHRARQQVRRLQSTRRRCSWRCCARRNRGACRAPSRRSRLRCSPGAAGNGALQSRHRARRRDEHRSGDVGRSDR